MDTQLIRERARAVLEHNLVRNETYSYTCPSPKTYQHQWLWDSCFHAIVWSHFDPEIAKSELKTLLKKQFANGLIPHMAYWHSPSGLIPKMGDWLFGGLWPEPDRSRITQPPLLPQAIHAIYKKTKDRAFVEQLFPHIERYFNWLYSERGQKISDDGLLSVIHPWETGMDLLPIWDHIHTKKRLLALRAGLWLSKIIKEYNKVDWQTERIKELNLFLVKDVAFNVIYILNLQKFADLCDIIGDTVKGELYRSRAETTLNALEKKCWDDSTGFYYSINALDDSFILELTVSGLFPICLNIDKTRLNALVQNYLFDENQFWLPFPIPCVAKSSHYFNPKGSSFVLWRGPTWLNCNWFLVKGLQKHGFLKQADHIITKTCELINRAGFREQYNPYTGEAYGAKSFGWSTLIVDLIERGELHGNP
ncbi:MAG: hypothetical protein EU536_01655 [Promethearchaeota archaeon]|nr:MAG: hypothetical protein EU536_01655 [Candidatus Lokiarchaeota archaeon]